MHPLNYHHILNMLCFRSCHIVPPPRGNGSLTHRSKTVFKFLSLAEIGYRAKKAAPQLSWPCSFREGCQKWDFNAFEIWMYGTSPSCSKLPPQYGCSLFEYVRVLVIKTQAPCRFFARNDFCALFRICFYRTKNDNTFRYHHQLPPKLTGALPKTPWKDVLLMSLFINGLG